MTKKQAVNLFKESFLSIDKKDKPMMREVWNNFTDALCKNGDITPSQYDRWTGPYGCN